MKIDGKTIAQEIFENLKKRVTKLKGQGFTPTLVVILVGNDPSSASYVGQKELKGNAIGAKVIVKHLPAAVSQQKLLASIEQLNNDNNVHAIIVQRPLPKTFDQEVIDKSVLPQKDVDGFHPQTPFQMPLAVAVIKILEDVFERSNLVQGSTFTQWLASKNIVVIGKGKTGGGPTIALLRKLGVQPLIIDSRTPNPDELIKNADIIISAVGKPTIINPSRIKTGAILISVGMHKGVDGKMHGDYEGEDVKDIASYYTPVPGGVGPMNVACLLSNVVKAAEIQIH